MRGPPSIPDHTLRQPIGRGSYGEVWLARNVMGTARAVKIVWRRQFESDRPYEREFAGIQRFEPVSRSADGLVHVLHIGRNDAEGYFYYVMELADSAVPLTKEDVREVAGEKPAPIHHSTLNDYTPRTLRSDLKRLGRLPVADCLRVALEVSGGLARLHERGLVHRDVKPGNIIFVEGRAKLADIGLVSKENEGRTFVGTEGYIPPEGPGSPAADLYALGMVLYEATTGYAREDFPKVPSDWFAEEASKDALEFHAVVLKACEGAKERRYHSAEEMQADLALLQSGQSVRRLRALEERVSRWRRIAWVGGVTVVLAVIATLAANWRVRVTAESFAKETELKLDAQKSLGRAERAERESRQQLNAALFEQARALVLSKEMGHRTRALESIRRARGVTNTAELRRIAFAALALADLRPDGEIALDPASTLVQPDPSFTRLAMCKGTGPVTIHSLPNIEPMATLPASTNLEAFVGMWSADSRHIAIKRQYENNGIRSDWEVWNVGATRRLLVAGPNVARNSVTFHPRQPLFMAGFGSGGVTEWNLESGAIVRTFKFPNTPRALAHSPDGERLAVSFWTDTNWVIQIRNAKSLEILRTIECPEAIELLEWHPHGQWLSGTCGNASTWARAVRIFDVNTGAVTVLGEHKVKDAINEFTADGRYLVSGGWDREIICWDLETRERAFTFAGRAYAHSWSADGRRCAIIQRDLLMQLFTFERPTHQVLFGNPGEAIVGGRYSSDGRWLIVRDDQTFYLWDLKNSAPAVAVPTPAPPRANAFFSPDNNELFVALSAVDTLPGDLSRWRIVPGAQTGTPVTFERLPVHNSISLARVAVTSNDLVISSAEGVRFTALTNVSSESGRIATVPRGGCFVSPDAKWLAMTYSYSPFVQIYELPAMKEITRLQANHFVSSVTFAPDSEEVLLMNRNGPEWFDTTSWQRTKRKIETVVSGGYAFYTPDGEGIWMVTHFRHAALFDRRTLEPILPLPNNVLPLAISPDGRQLAVSVEGRRVQLVDVVALRRDLAELGLDW